MKEALSVIASAWSVAFIVMFAAVCAFSVNSNPVDKEAYAYLFCILLASSITGIGWLIYRHNSKRKDAKNG